MSDKYSFSNLLIQVIATIGAWLIAAIAIWGNKIKDSISGPKLKINLHDPKGEMTSTDEGEPCRYYHIDVINCRKYSKANNVRVLVSKLSYPAADGSYDDDDLNSPIQLTWQFPSRRPQFLTIGYNKESCDLGYIFRNRHFRLSPYYCPNKYKIHLNTNQKMRLEVVAVAENSESNKLTLEISWDVNWSEDGDQMKKHVVIKEISNFRKG